MRRVLKNKTAFFGLILLLLMLAFTIFVPILSVFEPNKADFSVSNAAPDCSHFFGTDTLGRDQMARVSYGMRVSFLVGLLATAVSVLIGVLYGSIAGYRGGKTDYAMMRFVDILYGLPFMFFVIVMIVYLGRNIYNLFIALGAVQWLTMSRIVRGQVLSLKQREFVESAKALGMKNYKIILKHIIPNLTGPVIAYACLLIPTVMIEESFLSFLGLGIQPPNASLGTLIAQGVNVMESYWWMLFFPCMFFITTLLGLNFFGEGLREVFDPHSQKSER